MICHSRKEKGATALRYDMELRAAVGRGLPKAAMIGYSLGNWSVAGGTVVEDTRV